MAAASGSQLQAVMSDPWLRNSARMRSMLLSAMSSLHTAMRRTFSIGCAKAESIMDGSGIRNRRRRRKGRRQAGLSSKASGCAGQVGDGVLGYVGEGEEGYELVVDAGDAVDEVGGPGLVFGAGDAGGVDADDVGDPVHQQAERPALHHRHHDHVLRPRLGRRLAEDVAGIEDRQHMAAQVQHAQAGGIGIGQAGHRGPAADLLDLQERHGIGLVADIDQQGIEALHAQNSCQSSSSACSAADAACFSAGTALAVAGAGLAAGGGRSGVTVVAAPAAAAPVRKKLTSCESWSAWLDSDCAAAEVCSTSAPLRWVVSSIWPTAVLICSRPVACSREAAVISATMSETFFTAPTMSCRLAPAWATSWPPSRTWPLEVVIRVLMSFDAWAERCAGARTSGATTAKPLPASPARAASTEALSASRLVWKAISSIMPTISLILLAEASIPSMARTTLPITAPPLSAASRATVASWLAAAALSAFCFTVVVISCIEAAVSSIEAAWLSVRWARSWLPAAISAAASFTRRALSLRLPAMERSLSAMVLTLSLSMPKTPW